MVLALQLKADGFKNKSIQEASREIKSSRVWSKFTPFSSPVLRSVRLLPTMEETGIGSEKLRYYDLYGD